MYHQTSRYFPWKIVTYSPVKYGFQMVFNMKVQNMRKVVHFGMFNPLETVNVCKFECDKKKTSQPRKDFLKKI